MVGRIKQIGHRERRAHRLGQPPNEELQRPGLRSGIAGLPPRDLIPGQTTDPGKLLLGQPGPLPPPQEWPTRDAA